MARPARKQILISIYCGRNARGDRFAQARICFAGLALADVGRVLNPSADRRAAAVTAADGLRTRPTWQELLVIDVRLPQEPIARIMASACPAASTRTRTSISA